MRLKPLGMCLRQWSDVAEWLCKRWKLYRHKTRSAFRVLYVGTEMFKGLFDAHGGNILGG